MPLDTAKEKLARIDSLIKRRATGSPEHLSRTLGICRATWFNWLEQLKALGLPIAYDPDAQTYYYTRPGRALFIRWEDAGGG
jgi:predicted DNA-binding transcriptional regulator YafY